MRRCQSIPPLCLVLVFLEVKGVQMTDNTESSKSGDRTGQQLGNYCLLRLIGEGRDAQVYLAEHVELGQHAAMKVFQVELSERDSKLFYEQVRVFAPLVHPNILSVHEAGMYGTDTLMVMDMRRDAV